MERWSRSAGCALLLLLAGGLEGQQTPLQEARAHLQAGKPQAALEVLRGLGRRRARRADVLRLATEVHHALGNHLQVVNQAGRYLAKQPGDAQVLVWQGEALLALGQRRGPDTEDGRAYVEQALGAAKEALQTGTGPPGAVTLEARALLALGRPDAALEAARRAADRNPDVLRRRLLVALVLEARGEPGEAVALLRSLEKKHPGAGWIPCERGLIHERQGQEAEARRAFARALRAPDLDAARRRVAGERVWLHWARRRDWEGAREVVQGWLESHPRDPLAHWWRGYLAELQGRTAKARGWFERAWELSGGELGRAALHLGHLLAEDDEERAVELLGEAVRLATRPRPGIMSAEDRLIALAKEHFLGGRLRRAAGILRSAAQHRTRHHTLLQNLGYVLRELGSRVQKEGHEEEALELWKEAARHYVRASELVLESGEPERVKAQILNDTGIMFHYHLGQQVRGAAYYMQALEHDPDYVDALENLGQVACERKRWKEAVALFDRVLELVDKRPKSERLRRLALKKLEEERASSGEGDGGEEEGREEGAEDPNRS